MSFQGGHFHLTYSYSQQSDLNNFMWGKHFLVVNNQIERKIWFCWFRFCSFHCKRGAKVISEQFWNCFTLSDHFSHFNFFCCDIPSINIFNCFAFNLSPDVMIYSGNNPAFLLYFWSNKRRQQLFETLLTMRLCQPPDGSTSPKYKLLCFITT